MYQTHFGLKKPLFESGIAQDAAVYLAPKHELIVANTKVALTTLDSAVVLTGTSGVGKTTLISSALRTTSTRLALGWVTGAPVNGAELLELLLVEFGFNAHRVGRVERMQMWRQFLNEMSATESRVFVIVERADDLSHEVLRALDSLTAVDPNGSLGANLVLLGQPALLDHLRMPLLESLRQRIRLRERLEPFTADELRAYLAHQVTRAGGSLDRVFAPSAFGTLHKLSGGIPRLANNLCETALTLAATGKETLLTPELLTRVAVAMFGIESPTAASAPTAMTTAPPTVAQVPDAKPAAPEAAVQSRDSASPQIVSATFSTAVAFPAPGAPTYTPPVARDPAEAFAARAAIVSPPAGPAPATAATAPTPSPAPGRAPVAPAVTAAPTAPAAPAPVAPAPAPAPVLAAAPVEPMLPSLTAAPTPRADPAPIVTRSVGPPAAKPMPERAAHSAPAAQASFPPVIPSRASAPAAPAEPEPAIDSFAETFTEVPDVLMADLPVLTDAVEPAPRVDRPRARAEMAYARHDAAPPAAHGSSAAPPRSTPSQPGARPAAPAPAPAPSAAAKAAVPAAPKAAPAPPGRSAPPPAMPRPSSTRPAAEVSEEELEHQTQTVRALAAAKSIDDISNSMAETLFGEADLDMLNAALGAAGWPDPGAEPTSEKRTQTTEPTKAATPPPKPSIEEDPFDLFGLGPDAPLELIDDSKPPGDGRKAANNR